MSKDVAVGASEIPIEEITLKKKLEKVPANQVGYDYDKFSAKPKPTRKRNRCAVFNVRARSHSGKLKDTGKTVSTVPDRAGKGPEWVSDTAGSAVRLALKEDYIAASRSGLRFTKNTNIDCGSAINLAGSFTIEFWARRAGNNQTDIVLGKGKVVENQKVLYVGLYGPQTKHNQFVFGFYNADVHSKHAYPDNDWHHWACVYDREAKKGAIYRDGLPIELENDGTIKDFLGNDDPVMIGQSPDAHFNGDIAEVRIWKTARNARDIFDLWDRKLSGPQQDLLAYYDFDSGAAWDASGNGHDGVITGELARAFMPRDVEPFAMGGTMTMEAWVKPAAGEPNRFCQIVRHESDTSRYTLGLQANESVLQFKGTNHYAQIASNILGQSVAFTVSAWARPREEGLLIFNRGDEDESAFSIYAADGRWHARLQFDSNTAEQASGGEFAVNKWVHIAATFSGSTLSLFINGVQVGQKTIS